MKRKGSREENGDRAGDRPAPIRLSTSLSLAKRTCCGRRMDEKGVHGLPCKFSAGRHPQHAALNDVVKRALQKAGFPSTLKPNGMDRGDEKRPDGITAYLFNNGRQPQAS